MTSCTQAKDYLCCHFFQRFRLFLLIILAIVIHMRRNSTGSYARKVTKCAQSLHMLRATTNLPKERNRTENVPFQLHIAEDPTTFVFSGFARLALRLLPTPRKTAVVLHDSSWINGSSSSLSEIRYLLLSNAFRHSAQGLMRITPFIGVDAPNRPWQITAQSSCPKSDRHFPEGIPAVSIKHC